MLTPEATERIERFKSIIKEFNINFEYSLGKRGDVDIIIAQMEFFGEAHCVDQAVYVLNDPGFNLGSFFLHKFIWKSAISNTSREHH